MGSFLESIRRGDIAQRCLVVGSARQAQGLLGGLSKVQFLREKGRYPWFTGETVPATGTGVPISVISLGAEAHVVPNILDAAVCGGARMFILVDKCIAFHVAELGRLMIVGSALRYDSVGCAILPDPFPAVCNRHVVAGLEAAASAAGTSYEVGMEMTGSNFGWHANPKREHGLLDLSADDPRRLACCYARAGSIGCLWATSRGGYPFGVINASVSNLATNLVDARPDELAILACQVALNAIVRLDPYKIVPTALLP